MFTANAPAIISYEDALKDLERHSERDFTDLSKAIERCNLATLAFIILRPDTCWTLADTYKPSRKGKEKETSESIRVAQRNDVLFDAWESFWTIMPAKVKASEEALGLWLDFATQVRWAGLLRSDT